MHTEGVRSPRAFPSNSVRVVCVVELEADWEEGLSFLSLSGREVVQESRGFIPLRGAKASIFMKLVRWLLESFKYPRRRLRECLISKFICRTLCWVSEICHAQTLSCLSSVNPDWESS